MAKKITWYKPSWFILLTTIIGISIFSSLGIWQLQRAEYKKQILLENERRKNSAPINLTLPIDDPTTLRYQRVSIQGHFISSKQFVLDNQMHQHRVGYNILTPFLLEASNTIVIIDRGWVPMGADRNNLPSVSIDEEPRSIIGTVYVPFGKPFHLGGLDDGQDSWPRLIQYLDFIVMGERLEQNILPLLVRMEPNQSGGYITEWPVFAFTPNRHLGYAVQWFSLAITVFIIFLYFHMKTHNQKGS